MKGKTMAAPEFSADASLVKKVERLEGQLRDLQTVVLILVAKTADDNEQAKRLAEMIFKHR